jgi:hypothetical protein
VVLGIVVVVAIAAEAWLVLVRAEEPAGAVTTHCTTTMTFFTAAGA